MESLEPIPWIYIYSPKYELFHHTLHTGVSDCSGFVMKPCFFPQSAFSGLYKEGAHFMSGNCIKFLVIVEELRRHPGQHVLVTDVDLIIDNPAGLRDYLEPYKQYEITYMQESPGSNSNNIGFAMIQSTEATIQFYEQILEGLQKNPDLHDQAYVNERLLSFPGLKGMFEGGVILNSNYYTMGAPFFVIQSLCSQETYEKNLWEKLVTFALFYDLEPMRPLIPEDVWETLVWYYQTRNPTHPLACSAPTLPMQECLPSPTDAAKHASISTDPTERR